MNLDLKFCILDCIDRSMKEKQPPTSAYVAQCLKRKKCNVQASLRRYEKAGLLKSSKIPEGIDGCLYTFILTPDGKNILERLQNSYSETKYSKTSYLETKYSETEYFPTSIKPKAQKRVFYEKKMQINKYENQLKVDVISLLSESRDIIKNMSSTIGDLEVKHSLLSGKKDSELELKNIQTKLSDLKNTQKSLEVSLISFLKHLRKYHPAVYEHALYSMISEKLL